VLSLDVLRAIEKEKALESLLAAVETMAAGAAHTQLDDAVAHLRRALGELRQVAARSEGLGRSEREAGARDFAFGLARLWTGAAMLEHAAWAARQGEDLAAVAAARRWCRQELVPARAWDAGVVAESRILGVGPALA
jgi:hypothetical protein